MAAGPERPAVTTADGTVTYAELDRLAVGVAHWLLDQRAPADVPVLLDLEPGLLLVAAQLGVWRAGRFFVALDATAPPERNAAIAADAGAVVALVGRTGGLRRPRGGARELELDRTQLEIHGEPLPSPAPGTIAALTYTSGSTGRPKGVIQTHGSVLRNVRLTREALGISPGDRAPLLYPPSVNPALRELLTVLLSGAEVMPFRVTTEGVAGLGDWLRTSAPTVYSSGVTLFRQLAALTPRARDYATVHRVKLGGEPVTRGDIASCRRLFAPEARLYFGLGTTETGTVTTCFLDAATPVPSGVPLGRPATDLELQVIDGAGQAVADGEVGELLVVGADLAAGYWRDRELTERCFVPVAGRAGVVGYRTGDRVRRTADGGFEHHGRVGAQVKIRGLRIEPVEVEMALADIAGVAAAAIAAVADPGTAEPCLVAFLVPALGGPTLDRGGLRRALAERLPLAMVPERFVVVANLPLRANGKLDRPALLGLSGRELPTERHLAYPQDPIETRLAALWCEVLGIELVGIDESFFDLGGDSGRAVELFRQIERRFGTALPVALVFEAPTVRLQAARLRDGLVQGGLAPVIRLAEGRPGAAALFCVPAVDGYPFVYRPLAGALARDRALDVLQFPGLDGVREPLDTVEALAEELVARMRERQPDGPYHLLGHSYGGLVAYEMVRQLTVAGERIAFLGLCDSHTPDGERWLARVVRDLELLMLGAGRVWRQVGRRGLVRLFATVRTLGQMTLAGYRRRLGGTLVEHTLHRVRAVSSAARRRYRFGSPLALPWTTVVLLRATPTVGSAHRWTRWVERDNGWTRRFTHGLAVREVPGDHIQMLNPPHVAQLAAELRSLLAVSETRTDPAPGRSQGG